MENERFELQNVADTVEIGSFQLQNAENSNENGRKSKSPPQKKNRETYCNSHNSQNNSGPILKTVKTLMYPP